MKRTKFLLWQWYLCAIFLTGLLSSCSKDDTTSSLQDGQSMVITDLPGDTAAAATTTGQQLGDFATLYFRFNTAAPVTITDSTAMKSDDWDLAFTGPFNAVIYVNDGTYQFNPGYGGPGKGAVIQVDTPYEKVLTAPSDADFNNSGVHSIGWDNGNGTGWFFYSLTNHIAVPVKNRTFIIRTGNGKYGKLQMINVYKGNPPVVTDLYWPAPYLTFRYFIQNDGSKNLRTSD